MRSITSDRIDFLFSKALTENLPVLVKILAVSAYLLLHAAA
jgi:hypothetical protein